MLNKKEQHRDTHITKKNRNFFSKLKFNLINTKKYLENSFKKLLKNKKFDDSIYEEIETKLIQSDIGIKTTQKIIDDIKEKVKNNKIQDIEEIYNILKLNMLNTLKKIEIPLKINRKKLFIILIVGVNGVGKTTTIAKLANMYKENKYSVMLVSADTFRAAAHKQLKTWCDKINIPSFIQENRKDPASIVFDAIKKAQNLKIEILIIDTAGRLHNKTNLMQELKKIVRTIKKIDSTAPHENMLIIDANIGQNSINQANVFCKEIGITGMTLTKMDGSAKGGVIFNLANSFNIPLRYVCIGEKINDIQEFNSQNFVNSIFS